MIISPGFSQMFCDSGSIFGPWGKVSRAHYRGSAGNGGVLLLIVIEGLRMFAGTRRPPYAPDSYYDI